MKNVILMVIMILGLSACGTVSHLTPGVPAGVYADAHKYCKDKLGLKLVNVSLTNGYTAYCNDRSWERIKP
tara:strand:- start:444 stop:656 length:213 start_codon:yes stop_codon:yes gene_type:complete